MPQSLAKNLLHLVYSTKHRQPWIPADVRERLYAYQAGIFKEWDSPAIVIGGVEDHVHALFSLSKNHALKTVVEEVKKGKFEMDEVGGNGESGFPLAERLRRVLRQPVERGRRAALHREPGGASSTMSFQDELRALLPKHGIEHDERYVWD